MGEIQLLPPLLTELIEVRVNSKCLLKGKRTRLLLDSEV